MISPVFWKAEHEVQVAFCLFCQNLHNLSLPHLSEEKSRWPEGREV